MPGKPRWRVATGTTHTPNPTEAKANHTLLEATVGNNAEIRSLQRFVPAYFWQL
jgi:hypothetical protein